MVTAKPEPPAGAPAAPEKAAGWRRWRGPALFASVCLNLFLIGLMIGGAVPPRHRPHWIEHGLFADAPPPPPPPREPGPREPGRPGMMGQALPGGPGAALTFRQAVQALPEEDRRIFEQAMEAARPELQRQQRELRQARQRVNEAARAEPFDRRAMLAALEDVRRRQEAIQQRVHADTVDALARLSADSRRQFADALQQRPRP
jgi:uncharacterized membrane protein